MAGMAGEPSRTDSPRSETAVLRRGRGRLPALSLGIRIVVFVAGWTLVLIGVVGLVLPGIQGILTILFGAAILSLASETIYRLLRKLFRRWPFIWTRIEGLRRKTHEKLHREE